MQAFAAVAAAPWKVEFLPVEVPEPGDEDVVIRVTHSWISNGTEGSFVRGERIGGDTPRTESDPLPFPHVPGYQKVGVVERVGGAVTGFAVGDLVFATVSRVSAMFYPTGGHVSPAVTHQSQVWNVPEGLDPESASGLVLTQVGYNVGIRPEVRPGDACVVIGDGMVGHWSAQTLQHRGANVMLLGRHDERLKLFRTRAGDRTFRIGDGPAEAAIRDWAPKGVQVAADTVGDIGFLESLYPVMRRFSHISSAGFYGQNGRIDIQKMRDREMTLHAPSGWTSERMNATLDLLSQGELETLPLITHRLPADRAGEAFNLILQRREGVLGVVLDWQGVIG
jgi:2-desacetyl-2-hydroxyethyl bacteriochlorophyllide A dehydrogenase